MSKGKMSRQLYDTDRVMGQLFPYLTRDFRAVEGQDFARAAEERFSSGISEFRDYSWPELGDIKPSRFKRWVQLSSLYKRYRFQHDRYNDEELEALSNKSYLDFQQSVVFPENTLVIHKVCQEARKIAKGILGPAPKTIEGGRFGKRASLGCSFAQSYLDYKLVARKPFTSTSVVLEWFKQHVAADPHLSKLTEHQGLSSPDARLRTEFLKLVNVPKSWKTLRTITPLTLLGLFYSYGVGDLVAESLMKAGLDIRKLQAEHRDLAKANSITRRLVTADLSRASDSIFSWLLNRVLPRPWYRHIAKTFSRQVQLDGKMCFTHTVLPMGNGCTFPVETLVFYCLVKAIGNLLGVAGKYSVYGDDLIYPRKIHWAVARVLPMLGFTLNMDKTYAQSYFRESCGGDFYRGVDVRPFMFDGQRQLLPKKQYLAFLYQVYNGLTRRWDPAEISSTLHFLLCEISQLDGVVYRVPSSYPDGAGVHTVDFGDGSWWVPWSPIIASYAHGTRCYTFKSLAAVPERRAVIDVESYLWAWLSGSRDELDEQYTWKSNKPRVANSYVKRRIDRMVCRDPILLQRNRGLWCYPKVETVASKSAIRFVDNTGSVTDWT